MQEPKPFSSESDRLYDEYLRAGAREGWDSWIAAYKESSTPLADALALVDKAQNHPDFGPGSAAELAKLRDLAEVVRVHLSRQ